MRRRTVVAALVLLGVGAAAPAAWAEADGVEEGEVIGAHEAREITADFDLGSSNRLEVVDPAGEVVLAADRPDDGRLRLLLKTACPADPGEECAQGLPGANGRWLVRQSGVSSSQETPFFLRVGGAAPAEVTATLDGRTATVSWAPSRESDVTGWAVGDGAGTQRVTPEACDDARCSTTFGYPASQGGQRAFTVQAVRPSGVDDPAEVLGPAATSPPVSLPAPSEPPPPSAGPPGAAPNAGASGGPSATPGPGGVGATAQSFGQGFSSFSPSLGLPKLPPLPDPSAPAVAGPQVADTFEPSLGYDDSRAAESGTSDDDDVAAPRGRESTLTSTGGLLGDEQLLRSVAGALVLLMSGAHLRTWLARTSTDDA